MLVSVTMIRRKDGSLLPAVLGAPRPLARGSEYVQYVPAYLLWWTDWNEVNAE